MKMMRLEIEPRKEGMKWSVYPYNIFSIILPTFILYCMSPYSTTSLHYLFFCFVLNSADGSKWWKKG